MRYGIEYRCGSAKYIYQVFTGENQIEKILSAENFPEERSAFLDLESLTDLMQEKDISKKKTWNNKVQILKVTKDKIIHKALTVPEDNGVSSSKN